MNLAPLLVALLVGGLLAVQASANQQLNRVVGTPYGAAVLQLAVALLVLLTLAALTGATSALAALPTISPWWHLLGGLASPLYITAGILLFPRLGALTAVGLFVTGQVLASVALDLLAPLGLVRHDVHPGLLAGAAAVVTGIVVICHSQRPVRSADAGRPAPRGSGPVLRTAVSTSSATRPGWVLLGLAAGAVLPIQGALNAQLRTHLGAPLAVAAVSFTVALLAAALVLAVLLLTGRTAGPSLRGARELPWWGWLGGPCAAAYVTATFLLIPAIGAALTIALTVTGQQVLSAVIDHRGAFRLPRRPLTGARLTGLVLLITGAALVNLV